MSPFKDLNLLATDIALLQNSLKLLSIYLLNSILFDKHGEVVKVCS